MEGIVNGKSVAKGRRSELCVAQLHWRVPCSGCIQSLVCHCYLGYDLVPGTKQGTAPFLRRKREVFLLLRCLVVSFVFIDRVVIDNKIVKGGVSAVCKCSKPTATTQ